MSLLSIEQLHIHFGGVVAVDQLDLNVERGQIFSLIGPNGAGKTTVFNVISGIYNPAGGRVWFQGSDLRRPLNARAWAWFSGIALATGFFFVLLRFLEPLWVAGINQPYTGWNHASFSWIQSVRDMAAVFSSHLAVAGGLFVLGAWLGGIGSFVIWWRRRRTPDQVARQGIARTFQNSRLFSQMTVLDHVVVGMELEKAPGLVSQMFRWPSVGRGEKEREKRAGEVLEFVGLGKRSAEWARNLSYGEQRRLEIARALAVEPELLLLDEPAAGMNPLESRALMALIQKIRDRGLTVLLIEHDMKVVMSISDRIAVLDHGVKIAEGTPSEIQKDSRVLEAYLGKGQPC